MWRENTCQRDESLKSKFKRQHLDFEKCFVVKSIIKNPKNTDVTGRRIQQANELQQRQSNEMPKNGRSTINIDKWNLKNE